MDINTARNFRKNMTLEESKLWFLLRNKQLGVKFRRQAIKGKYCLDFYCASHKLAIELDGKQHRFVKKQKKHDNLRDTFLRDNYGITILRIENEFVNNHINDVLGIIKKCLENDFEIFKKHLPKNLGKFCIQSGKKFEIFVNEKKLTLPVEETDDTCDREVSIVIYPGKKYYRIYPVLSQQKPLL